MASWQDGTLQSSTLNGLRSLRRTQSAHNFSFKPDKKPESASLNSGRQPGQPSEFKWTSTFLTDSRENSVTSIKMSCASISGESTPRTSALIW